MIRNYRNLSGFPEIPGGHPDLSTYPMIFYLSFVSSNSALPINRQEDSASVLAVESSSPELDPEELPADIFPLLQPASLAAELNRGADEDAEEQDAAEGADALDIVFGTLDGCVSHRSASKEKS